MPWLLLLFVVLPAVELGLLIELGGRIGTPATLGVIVATGFVGAALARWQGLAVIGKIREETAEGRLPAGSLVDGVIILIAGALLVTPGVLTDAFGFLCLVPAFRSVVKRTLLRRFERAALAGRVDFRVHTGDGGVGGPWQDADPWEAREEKEVGEVGDDASVSSPASPAGDRTPF